MNASSHNGGEAQPRRARRPARAIRALALLLIFIFCFYILRLEAHTPADIILPMDYHAMLSERPEDENTAADSLDAYYQHYAQQTGRPYTIRQDLLLARLAYIIAPSGFQGDVPGVTIAKLCDAVALALDDPAIDPEATLGRNRQELESILAGLRADSKLGALEIRAYIDDPSGLAGYVLGADQALTMTLRGTDDTVDALDNVLLLPFNLSVQYKAVRQLLYYDDAAHIWLTGHSKGGHNAIYAASIDGRCHATAFNAPGFGIFLRDAQHDGLDRGVNYVINGDMTGFLLFHMERRIVLETEDTAALQALSFNNRHRLHHFFLIDDLSIATKIEPLGMLAEWATQLAWLLLILLVIHILVRLSLQLCVRVRAHIKGKQHRSP